MPIAATIVPPGAALDALERAVADAKAGDLLAPVAVIVPTNQSGVMARRALGRAGGVAGVDMITLNRLAELLAGPPLAAANRRPVSTPVLDLTIRQILRDEPGGLAPVADHPSTVVALRDLHRELRLADPTAVSELATTWRGAEPVRVSRAVTERLERGWYDEADLLRAAASLAAGSLPVALAQLVVFLPDQPDPASSRLLRALGAHTTVRVVATSCGSDAVDDATLGWLGELLPNDLTRPATPNPPVAPSRIVSTTDADDEVRIAVDALLTAARGAGRDRPVAFERMAVLWPTRRPYARLVEHHLTAAEIPWNGPSGTQVSERIAPRLLLDLLDVDRRGLRRQSLFALLADVPARGDDRVPLPVTEWERASRAAGVHGDDDWAPRLARLAGRGRWEQPASQLAGFVHDLRTTLGHPGQTRTWWEWADWCDEQLDAWFGPGAIRHWSDAEYRAWETLTQVLERLRHLDRVGPPVTRHEFRSVLAGELDDATPRRGRVGDGVTVGALGGAVGLDVDVCLVLGGAEGLLPPAPGHDAFLSDPEREAAGLSTSDEWTRRLHARLLEVIARSEVTVTIPRGDLRATTTRRPSRWLSEWADTVPTEPVRSHADGLQRTVFPASEQQRRVRDRLRATRAGLSLDTLLGDDPLAQRLLTLRHARASNTVTQFDGDLTSVGLAPLDAAVSPTQLETWTQCPHAYFMRYLLRVRDIEEPEAEFRITPRDRGSLQHEVLDRFHRDVVEGRLPPPGPAGWAAEHRAALHTHGEAVCQEWEAAGRTGRPATWVGERTRALADALEWLERDGSAVAAGGAVPIASEWRFSADDHVTLPLPDDRELVVHGAIDRVDRTSGGLVVTDHKTGRADGYRKLSDDDPTVGRTRFQLPAYAAAARVLAEQLGVDTSGTVRAEYSFFKRGGYRRVRLDFTDDVWSRVHADLGHVVAGIEAGWFPHRPPRPGFRLWVECPYCEPDGLGTGTTWAAWERKQHDPRMGQWLGEPDDD